MSEEVNLLNLAKNTQDVKTKKKQQNGLILLTAIAVLPELIAISCVRLKRRWISLTKEIFEQLMS